MPQMSGQPLKPRSRRMAGLHALLGRVGLLHPRTRWPVLLLVATVVLMSLERLLILVSMPARFAAVHALELVWAFLVGLRFDVVVGATLAAPLVLVLTLARPATIERRWLRRAVAGYAAVTLGALLLLCISDFYFFREFGQRLNDRVFEYAQYDYIWMTVLGQYPVVPALVVVIVAGLTAGRLLVRWGFDDRYNGGPKWQGVLWPTLMGLLLALAIRGGVGPKPLNTGPAFFSDSPVVTQLALNGGFTLREAAVSRYMRDEELNAYYRLDMPGEAFDEAQRALASEGDRFLGDRDNPLRRVTGTDRPRRDYNVVLVVMESMSWHYIGAMGGREGLTPNLDALIEQGVFMERCFAVGERTTRGITGIIAGFPDLPGDSVSTRLDAHRRFLTLGQVMEDRGYETMFIYGGQPYYDHRQAFLGGNGYDRFITDEDFTSQTLRTDLGWCDGDLYRTAHGALAAQPSDRPFFATLLTLSFHRPYAIPSGEIEPVAPDEPGAEQLNAIRYADHRLGRFMDAAREADYFEDTLFVFVADHPGGFADDAPNPAAFRVPFLIYGSEEVLAELDQSPRRVSTVCSQMDVAPTVLSLLGGEYEHSFFGSSVLDRPTSQGQALIQPGDGSLVYVDGQQRVAIVPPFEGEPRLLRFDAPGALTPVDETTSFGLLGAHRRRAVSLIQAADELYRRGAYHRRGRALVEEPAVLPEGASHVSP
ncbi:MAG: LTA synthase family protein [Phycisphaeraceae bacterium]